MKISEKEISRQEDKPRERDDQAFWKRYGAYGLLALLFLYVLLLAIGTYGELTHNEKILNFWLFK